MTTNNTVPADRAKALLAERMKSVAIRLGARIREARHAKQITLETLSKDADLSAGFLSRLERGESSASISNLIVIASRLGISLGDFFDDPEVRRAPSFVLSRASERGDQAPLTARGYSYQLTSGDLADQQMSAFELVYPPGDAMTPEVLTHDGEEVLYLLEGSVEFRIGDETMILQPGDCVHFSCNHPHSGRNIGDSPARLLMVVTPSNSLNR